MFTIYLARPEPISSRSWFYSSTLGLTPSLGSRDVELLSCFPIKGVTGKCRPRPWYNTSRLINRIITEHKSPTFALTWFPAFASIRKTPNQITSQSKTGRTYCVYIFQSNPALHPKLVSNFKKILILFINNIINIIINNY